MSPTLQPPQQVKLAQMRNTVEKMLASLGRNKLASDAGVDENADNKTTTHPSKNVDDGTQPATTGFRDAENSAQVKEEQGTAGVESASAAPSLDSVQPNIGTHQSLTGEDASIETSSTKDTKEDGGFNGPSSHPARTDNDSLNGGKYAGFFANLAQAESLGRELLAESIVSAGTQPAQAQLAKAAAAGAAAAEAALSPTDLQKQAEAVAADVLHQTILYAEQCAEKTAYYLQDFFQHLNAVANAQPAAAAKAAGRTRKLASDEPPKDDEKKEESGEEKEESGGGGGGSAPPAAEPSAPPPVDGGGGDPLAEMLGGADPAMGGDPGMGMDPGAGMPAPPPEMGADPMMDGDPGMGGAPGMEAALDGAPGGEDPLANLPPEVLQMLLQALQEQQTTPDQFKAAAYGAASASKRAQAKRAALNAYVRELSRG